MENNSDHTRYLLERWSTGQETDAEARELFDIVSKTDVAPAFKAHIESLLQQTPAHTGNVDWNNLYNNICEKAGIRKSRVRHLSFIRMVAAACVILLLGIGSYFMFFNNADQPIIGKTQKERFKNDVAPGSFRAKLTLADGTVITLDTATAGELARQGGTIVRNENGELVYQQQGSGSEVLYNTLATANGESYSTRLSDGTKVYLNAGSSIRFPVTFTGNERRVEITGEAYFEVVHNEQKPFKVAVNGLEVHDLGTEFNVNAYSNEASITTTLVSGSANVLHGSASQLLEPGQQASVTLRPLKGKGSIKLIKNADTDAATAWVKGVFRFNDIDIETLMRQMERWYDVKVVYEDKISSHFIATIPRSTSMINALKILEQTGGVKFRIENKTVTVFK